MLKIALRRIREMHGIVRRDMADRTGFTEGHLYRAEQCPNPYPPTGKVVKAYAGVFGMTPAEIEKFAESLPLCKVESDIETRRNEMKLFLKCIGN